MKLSENNQFIVDKLREKQLSRYVKPFKKMVELDKLGEIDIRPMTWKKIMTIFRDPFSDRYDLEMCISSYLIHFGLVVIPLKKKKVKKRVARERVKRHRMEKKALGYRQVSFMLSPADFERLRDLRKKQGFTYSEALNYLLDRCKK